MAPKTEVRALSNPLKKTSLYLIIVLPLRKSSLRKMIEKGHNNRQINLTVLENLKPIVCDSNYQHGDLKGKCNFRKNNFRLTVNYTIELAGEYFGGLRVGW